jgi:hypothetical protein
VRDLAFPMFGESLLGDLPGFALVCARDDSHPDAGIDAVKQGFGFTFLGWFRILDRRGLKSFGRREPGVRSHGNEDAGKEFRRQRRRHFQFVLLYDRSVLDEASISLIVRSSVVKVRQIVFEATRHHIEVDAPAV